MSNSLLPSSTTISIMTTKITLALGVTIAILLVLASSAAYAANITVAASEVDINSNGACSLLEAIENANDTTDGNVHSDCTSGNPSGADTISLTNSTYNLTASQTSTLGPSGLVITTDITITGNGAIIRRQSGGNYRLFYVSAAGDLTLDDVTLDNGSARGGNGGKGVTGSSPGFGGGGGGGGLGGNGANGTAVSNCTSKSKGGGGGGEQGAASGTAGGATTGGNGSTGGGGQAGGVGGGGGGGGQSGTCGARGGGAGGFGGGGGGGGNATDGSAGGFGAGGGGAGLNNNTQTISGGSGGTFGSDGEGVRGSNRTGGGGGGAAGLGGAIIIDGGTVIINRSTLMNNVAQGGSGGSSSAGDGGRGAGLGGAIFVRSGNLTVTNSTFTANSALEGSSGNDNAQGRGAAVFIHDGTVTLNYNTISDNTNTTGGTVYLWDDASVSGVLNMTGNIIANTDKGDDCSATSLTTNAFNLVEDNTCSPAISGDPLLDALGDYGGDTQTMALADSSPAIDQISSGSNGCGSTVTTDQRGVTRPQRGDCDIGAYEAQFPEIEIQGNGQAIANGDTTPTPSDHTDFGLVPVGTTLTRTFTISNSGPGDLKLSGSPIVTVTNASGFFSLTETPSSPIGSGLTDTFEITYEPTAAGVHTATIAIENNDSDETPYTFTISATSTVPEIEFDQLSYTYDETGAASGASVMLTRSYLTGTSSVQVNFVDNSATGGASPLVYPEDYDNSTQTIIFSDGQISQTVSILITSDTVNEVNETLTMTLSVPLTATLGANSTADLTITDDDFNLVINEFDYNQPGTDTAEFIELKNVGPNSINLDDYTVELVQGSGGGAVVYDTIDLPNVNLAAGDYYVICGNSATVPNCDLEVSPSQNLIQNGVPDAIGLRLSGTLKDAVSYEGDSGAPYIEGSGVGLEDVATDAVADKDKGLSRYLDGADTDQNNVDFSLRCITPGAANTSDNSQCGDPVIEFTLADYQVNEDGAAVGSSITLTRTGKITNASQVVVSFGDDTATGSGIDYTSDPITVTFPAGDTGSQTVTVPVTQDFLNEPAETLTMTLTAVTNAFIGTQVTAMLTIVDDDIPAVLVSPISGLTTTEAGSTDTFQLVLQSQPTNVVTVSVVSSDTGEGLVSPVTITFTSLTWNTSQTVTVTGQDDAVDDGDQSYTIETTAQSSDSDYNGISVADVSVTNLDDDTRGVTVTPVNLTVTEGGITDTYTVVLNSQPTAAVSVNVSSGTQLEVKSTSPIYDTFITLTFTTLNWNEAQTVTVQAIDDTTVEGDHSGVITHTVSGGDYSSESASDVTASLTDNDQSFAIIANQASITEGDTGSTGLSFTVTRSGAVTTTTGSVDFSLGGTANNGTDYSNVAPVSGTVTFATSQTQQPITLEVLGDFSAEANETIVLTLTNPIGPGDEIFTIISAQTVISDDDTAGFTIAPTSGLTTTEMGGTASFSVQLNTQPTTNVTITLTSGDSSEGIVNPTMLVFSPLTWQTAQTVTVTGQDDALADGDTAYIIQTSVESGDSNYSSLDPDDVALVNLDDDTAGFEIDPTSLAIDTPSDSDTFNIALTSQPTATVTIDLSSADPDLCTVSPASVTLDTLSWQSGVIATVTAVEAGFTDEAQLCEVITSAASSSDPNYNNLDVPDVSVTVGELYYLYLPIMAKRLVIAPDLIITDLQATSTDVTITIVNTGTAAVVDAFWIDVYFDLDTPPNVNQPWPTTGASHGVVWGLAEADLPIMPGESRTLTLADATQFFDGQQLTSDPPYPVGVTVYGYVDSVSLGSSVAAVDESDESNNLFGPITSEAGGATSLTVTSDQSLNDELMPSR